MIKPAGLSQINKVKSPNIVEKETVPEMEQSKQLLEVIIFYFSK